MPELEPVTKRRTHQWGAERPRGPLPAVERPASHAATWMGGFAIVATVALWLAYLRRTVLTDILSGGFGDSGFIVQTVAYVLVMTLLTFSALMYLIARQGALYRTRSHHRVPRAEMDAQGQQPGVAVAGGSPWTLISRSRAHPQLPQVAVSRAQAGRGRVCIGRTTGSVLRSRVRPGVRAGAVHE